MSGEERNLQSNSDRELRIERNYHSGPLPAPETLQKYNQILPGLADRIVKMAENQSIHRQKLESRVVWFDGFRSTLGLFFGFAIAIGGIVAGAYLIANGHSAEGLASILVPSGAIVGAFVYQQKTKKGGIDN